MTRLVISKYWIYAALIVAGVLAATIFGTAAVQILRYRLGAA